MKCNLASWNTFKLVSNLNVEVHELFQDAILNVYFFETKFGQFGQTSSTNTKQFVECRQMMYFKAFKGKKECNVWSLINL
jgi:hypothetical protein